MLLCIRRSIKYKLEAAFRDVLEPAQPVALLLDTQHQTALGLEELAQPSALVLESQPHADARLGGPASRAMLESKQPVDLTAEEPAARGLEYQPQALRLNEPIQALDEPHRPG